MSTEYQLVNTFFEVMGWEISYDSNGFIVCKVPDDKELRERPRRYSSGSNDLLVFIDYVSYEEKNIHMAMLSSMTPYINYMIENRLSFIIFPKKATRDQMIKSIVEVFPDRYNELDLRNKEIVSSSGYRKCHMEL